MNVAQQAPTPKEDDLVTYVAKILREDISIPYGVHIDLRQPPINEDDHDSWAEDNGLETWLYVAQSVVDAVDSYRLRGKKDA